MADKFGIGVIDANTSLQLTNCSQLAQILREDKLGADRILDPKTIPTLWRLTGVEVIVTGNYTALDNTIYNCKSYRPGAGTNPCCHGRNCVPDYGDQKNTGRIEDPVKPLIRNPTL